MTRLKHPVDGLRLVRACWINAAWHGACFEKYSDGFDGRSNRAMVAFFTSHGASNGEGKWGECIIHAYIPMRHLMAN